MSVASQAMCASAPAVISATAERGAAAFAFDPEFDPEFAFDPEFDLAVAVATG